MCIYNIFYVTRKNFYLQTNYVDGPLLLRMLHDAGSSCALTCHGPAGWWKGVWDLDGLATVAAGEIGSEKQA